MNSLFTKEILQQYFDSINKGGWESLIADDIVFTNGGNRFTGKDAYVEALGRFLRVARSVELKKLIIEGNNACAVASYALQSPKGNTAVCEVAEVLFVRGGKIASSSIYFDTETFREFIARG
jgi:ketosteroid isomerase-like protein